MLLSNSQTSITLHGNCQVLYFSEKGKNKAQAEKAIEINRCEEGPNEFVSGKQS